MVAARRSRPGSVLMWAAAGLLAVGSHAAFASERGACGPGTSAGALRAEAPARRGATGERARDCDTPRRGRMAARAPGRLRTQPGLDAAHRSPEALVARPAGGAAAPARPEAAACPGGRRLHLRLGVLLI